jgi:hypothetical protein
MPRISRSTRIYIALIVALAVLAGLSIFLPQGQLPSTLPEQELPASKPIIALVTAGIMLVIYGGLGYLGLRLAQTVGFADLWDPAVTNRQRFIVPALAGLGMGIFFIGVDLIVRRLLPLDVLSHPPFPMSLIASATAGIGEETIFRLFFVSFWMWLIGFVILRGRGQRVVFWGVSVLSALAFAFGHIPSVMFILGVETIQAIPWILLVEIVLLNSALSLFAADYLRRYGFLAAVGIHFWTDIVWHVIWGLIA